MAEERAAEEVLACEIEQQEEQGRWEEEERRHVEEERQQVEEAWRVEEFQRLEEEWQVAEFWRMEQERKAAEDLEKEKQRMHVEAAAGAFKGVGKLKLGTCWPCIKNSELCVRER